MRLNRSELREQFKNNGLNQGDTILIHSSLRSFGQVEGGAFTVVRSLMDTIGEEGTLIFPTLTGRREDSPDCLPVFNVLNSKCWTGIIPETVRNMEGYRRSLHPTHSATATGCWKEFLTSSHEQSKSPCDEESPFYKNALLGGYIMLAGVDQESNTSIHSCEEIAGVPYHLQKEIAKIDITDYNGKKITVTNRLHNWDKPQTNFNKLDELFKIKGIMRTFMIGKSQIRFIRANDMFQFTIELLNTNPEYLLV